MNTTINEEHTRSYAEAVNIMIDWWIQKSFHGGMNQDNGDKSDAGGFGFLLMNTLSLKAQSEITPEQIERFKAKLVELLIGEEAKGRYYKMLDVDYNPDKKLLEACQYAEISTNCLPCKTFTFIDKDNKVKGRNGYGADWFEL